MAHLHWQANPEWNPDLGNAGKCTTLIRVQHSEAKVSLASFKIELTNQIIFVNALIWFMSKHRYLCCSQ